MSSSLFNNSYQQPIMQQTPQTFQMPQQTNMQAQNLKEITNMYNVLKGSQNPLETLNKVAGNNPIVQKAISAVQMANGDYSQALNNIAAANGINQNQVNEMLTQLSQMVS